MSVYENGPGRSDDDLPRAPDAFWPDNRPRSAAAAPRAREGTFWAVVEPNSGAFTALVKPSSPVAEGSVTRLVGWAESPDRVPWMAQLKLGGAGWVMDSEWMRCDDGSWVAQVVQR